LSAAINITRTAPGLFAGGQVVHSHPDDPAVDRIFLLLYGTGIRHRAGDASLTATVNGVGVPVQSAAQGTYPGLDQLNLELPRSLAGAETVDVVITVEGRTANTIQVSIQ
jgi:uncharacterized protein (TIGR03437 family)